MSAASPLPPATGPAPGTAGLAAAAPFGGLAGLHGNHRAFWRHLARACGGSAEEIPNGLLVATGIPAAPFNQVHCDAQADLPATAGRAATFFAERGLPWRLICDHGPGGSARG